MRSPRLSQLRLLSLLCLTTLLGLLSPQGSRAADYSAGCTFGIGNVSALINAINSANSTPDNDIINLGASCSYQLSTVNNTTGGSNGLPVITAGSGTLTINGNGSAITAGSGFFTYRIFYVASGANLTLNSLIVANGQSDLGGGIYNAGTLMLNNSTVSGNIALIAEGAAYGAGIFNTGTLTVSNSTVSANIVGDNLYPGSGGGIYSSGTLTVSNSTFSSNTASISGSISVGGGGIYTTGALTVSSSIFTNNLADCGNSCGNQQNGGGGIYVAPTASLNLSSSTFSSNKVYFDGSAIYNAGTAAVSSSTFSSNDAHGGEGTIYNAQNGLLNVSSSTFSDNDTDFGGGAIDNFSGTVTVYNSTISGNVQTDSEGGGAGISNYGGTMTIVSSTIVNNSARESGGGIDNAGGTVSLTNTIVAGNTVDSGGDLAGAFDSQGYNLIGNSTGATGLVPNDLTDAAAVPLNLGVLQNNGGPTETIALGVGSVAINHGDPAFVPPPDFDQRGAGFPRVRGTRIDIGAYEAPNTAPVISNITNKTINEDTPTSAIAFIISDTESAASSLTLSAESSDTTKVPVANIVFGGSGSSRTVTVTPAANQNGSVTITITVSDGELTASDSFVLTITSINDSPSIGNVPDQSTVVNIATAALPVTISDVETAAASLTLNKNSSNTTLVPLANIVFGGSGANRTVTITPAPNQIGTATLTLMVQDANGGSASDSFVLTVNPAAIFSDGFESGNLSSWTSSVINGGDLSVTGSAALMGSFGMQALIDDTATLFVTDDTPVAEPRYRARFMFDPKSVAMANNDNFSFFFGFQGASTGMLQAQLRRSAGAYQVRVGTMDDNNTWFYSPFVTISDAPHLFELDWQAATGVGANNGALIWWLDEVIQTGIAALDTDTRRIDRVRFGGTTGIDAGTSGMVYFDAFISRRLSYIGRLISAPTLVSPPDASFVAREVSPSLNWNGVFGATQYYAEWTNGTSVNLNSGWIAGTTWAPGIQPPGPYTWRVKARNASGEESAWSATRTLTVRPGVPTNVQGTVLGATWVSLTWNASIDAPAGITGYRVYRGGVQIANVGSGVTSFTDTNATVCAANQYKVRSVNGSVTSLDSNLITVNTLCDAIFSDGFESGNLSAWSLSVTDGGNLSVTAAAQLTGSTRGLQALINDGNPLYVGDDTPVAEPRYRARFFFDPNGVAMANNDNYSIFYGFQGTGTSILQVQIRRFSGTYQLRAAALDDAGTWIYSPYVTISDAPHMVELDWQAASAAGANNGTLNWWVDEIVQTALTALDTDTRRVDRVRLGAVAGMDAGTSGTVYFDAFRSTRFSYIGAEVGGLGGIIEPTAEPTEVTHEPTAEVLPEVTDEPTMVPTDEPTMEPTAVPTEEPTAIPLPTGTPTPEPTLLPFTLPVFQTMDDGAPLWSASAGWHLGAEVAYGGLGWQAVASGQVETLALNVPVTLSAAMPLLSFQSKLSSGALPEIRVSLDGVTWQTVALVMPSLNWALVTMDLSAYAGQTIRVQFVWASLASVSETWQVDEVTIADGALVPPPVEPSAPAPPVAPGSAPPGDAPTVAPREGSMPERPADLPQPPTG